MGDNLSLYSTEEELSFSDLFQNPIILDNLSLKYEQKQPQKQKFS